jgi:nucleoid-associated protein YgaU
MTISRYSSDSLIQGGKFLGTNKAIQSIREAMNRGEIATTSYVIQEGDRLDSIAGRFYGDGRLWWVIAATSGIGWWLQVPPGTRLVIPTDLNQIEGVI